MDGPRPAGVGPASRDRERWREVSRIYAAVAAARPQDREQTLAVLCRDDRELRLEVESLLRDVDATGLLDAHVSHVAADFGALPPNVALGTLLGPYRVDAKLGAGGMGEVYRATDTRLQRTVAIKVLPPAHAADPQFRARFDREAQVIAALTDPHVCRVYDVGQHADTAYIVMEYLEGETLAARLSRGTLPFVQALAWAIDIAEALAAAHRLGVVHRDLKPGNVMLTRSGAMLLDFGLAKATTAHLGAPASLAATAPDHLTAQGTILGTFQYMSPEQLEGRDADARSDIFAFGALAYEMFTGNKAFEAKSQASLIAAILEREPPPIAAVQPLSPPSVDRVVKACLAKDPDQRWQNAADLARELRWCGEPIATAVRLRARRRLMLASLAATVLVALAGVLVAAAILSKTRSATSADVVRFAIQPPEDRSFSGSPAGGSVPLAISPDGRRAVFGVEKDGVASLWVRSLDSLESHELPGTTNPRYPFWSPDNRFVGFFTQTDLKKVDLEGGAAQKIVDADNGTGGSWRRDGNILYALLNRGLFLVAASGGTPKPLPSTDVARPRFPWLLPDGIHFIVSQANTDRGDVGTVYFGSIDGGQLTPVVEAARGAKYAVGHLLFVRGQTLFAQPFDPEKGVVSGIAAPLLEGVASTTTGAAAYSMSDRVLLHATGDRTVYQLQWVDRTGRLLEKIGSPNTYSSILLSKDERRIFTTRRDPTGIQNVWQFTTDRGVDTLAGAGDNNPVLSPDGVRIAVGRQSTSGVWTFPLNRDSERHLLMNGVGWPTDWSPDGHSILLQYPDPAAQFDIGVVDPDRNSAPVPVVHTRANDSQARFSPDGKWIAYTSDASGRPEIYVRPFPPGGETIQVSNAGGIEARWRDDGRQLYYVSASQVLTAVDIQLAERTATVGAPQALFPLHVRLNAQGPMFSSVYAPAAHGTRFLVREAISGDRDELVITLNWPRLLDRAAANGR